MKIMKKRYLLLVSIIVFTLIYLPTSIEAASDGGYVDELFENESTDKDTNEDESSDKQAELESDQSDQSALGKDKNENLIFTIMKIILALAFILGLMYLLLKFFNKRTKLYKHANTLENIGGVPLGSNKSIQMIRIGESIYVVGVADNIELLTEITDEETKKTLLENQSDQTNSNSNSNQMVDVIGKTLSRISPKKHEKETHDKPSDGFSTFFKNELEGLTDKRKKITKQYKRKEEDKNE